jgi:hypothetical protein
MAIQVERESLSTKARFVTPTYTDKDGVQQVVGSDKPMPMESLEELRLLEGKSFAIGVVRDFANPLPATQSIDIALAFPSGVTPSITINGLCAGNAMGYLYENASVTGGTSITPINKNRNSTIASQGVALLNPTVNSLGTMILSQILIGGEGKKASGGTIDGSDLILKPLTTYLFRLTNVNGTDHAAEIILGWYE